MAKKHNNALFCNMSKCQKIPCEAIQNNVLKTKILFVGQQISFAYVQRNEHCHRDNIRCFPPTLVKTDIVGECQPDITILSLLSTVPICHIHYSHSPRSKVPKELFHICLIGLTQLALCTLFPDQTVP